MKRFIKLKPLALSLIPAFLFFLGILWQPLSFLDALICDGLYRQLSGVTPRIKIIAIDEETLKAYGKFETWSREKTAQTVELLSRDPEHRPELIGIDLLFTDKAGSNGDAALVQACREAGNVVMASNIVYRGKIVEDSHGKMTFDDRSVSMVESPFEELAQVTDNGFVNALIAGDGHVRCVRLLEQHEGHSHANFSWKLYSLHEKLLGRQAILPKSDAEGQLAFSYSGGIGEFPHFSMSQVLEGKVPASEFKDCIVLIGAYAPGFQDAYGTPVNRGGQMYGVEIHANVIQALMEGKTAVNLSSRMYLTVGCVVLFLFFLLASHQKLGPVLAEGTALIGLHLLAGRLLCLHGYLIPQLYFLWAVLMVMLYFVVEKYLTERLRKKKLMEVFKTYVAPQVVDVLSKDDQLSARLGGEKRHVAVLFVDIRGFTSMSEGLPPEDVVKILNEYLALTTRCVFQNQGTLDKFIGDATMAVFNAPVDLPDYIFRAVSAALDMQKEVEPMSEKLMELYGKNVSFGIGIHCGEAVIGNIGCQVRMDYTAIGDTVNTAARLESCAGRGEILISQNVHEQIKDRIATEFVAEMELKGKAHSVKTYRVLGYKEDKRG